MLWINLLGGAAVLGSYAHGLATHPEGGDALWGGVLPQLRPLYTAGMLLAALGYLAFTCFLLVHLEPDKARVGRRFGFRLFTWLYVGILIPSALWMPLTWRMIEQPSAALWWGIRAILAAVGLAALGMVVALGMCWPKAPRWAHHLALVGSIVFLLHTGVLDALVWPAVFGR
jgi:hypothetical protein